MNKSNVQSIFVFVLALIVVSHSGCSKNENVVGTNPIIGSGRLVSEQRNVWAFTGIRVTNFGRVFVKQDTTTSLRIESDDNIIGLVATSVDRGVLVVGLREGSYNNVTVNVYASMRSIRLLESVGAADFLTTSPMHTDTITCRITGAGTITLAGTTTQETVEITGAGNVRNFDLVSARCFVSISGTGNVEVYVTQQLDAIISGAGSITYDGHPSVVNQTILGVGSIKPRP